MCTQDTPCFFPYPHSTLFYTHTYTFKLWKIVSVFCVFQIYCHLQHFVAGSDHRLSRRLEPNMHQRQPQYDLSPTYRYMIAVCMFVNGCGNFIDNVCHCLCLYCLLLSDSRLDCEGHIFNYTFTRKLNGNMSSLIKLFFFQFVICLFVFVVMCVCAMFVVMSVRVEKDGCNDSIMGKYIYQTDKVV